jgi:hypothetical protein
MTGAEALRPAERRLAAGFQTAPLAQDLNPVARARGQPDAEGRWADPSLDG